MSENTPHLQQFERRVHGDEPSRGGDVRSQYDRDRARIIHSAGFRRLQGKTQVMGTGEGDFHRTRLTHSIEAAQIGQGLVAKLRERYKDDPDVLEVLPQTSLIEAACYAHDLGHPPFGHGGEKALHAKTWAAGGFEGNGQTLRMLVRLEKHKAKGLGLNPTRRLVLAVLKYGVPYSRFPEDVIRAAPPKCYFNSEDAVVADALSPLSTGDRDTFRAMGIAGHKPSPQYMTLDASLMEMADDIAYAVHDLEDIVGRKYISGADLNDILKLPLSEAGTAVSLVDETLTLATINEGLFNEWSGDRKQIISRLVNLFVNTVEVTRDFPFESPLLNLQAVHPEPLANLLLALKTATYRLVVRDAGVQQLEVRGQRIVGSLFSELLSAPESLIPKHSWEDLDPSDVVERRVADYVAGMTDSYAQRIYQRLFTPGYGSSRDEL